MEAKELRIGNWVYNIDVPIQVYSIQHFFEGEEPDLHPIPLTPEILEKAGFNRSPQWPDTFKQFYHVTINCHFDLIHFDDDTFVFHTIAPNLHIKYLHQLQNLYFALTGQELDIQL